MLQAGQVRCGLVLLSAFFSFSLVLSMLVGVAQIQTILHVTMYLTFN